MFIATFIIACFTGLSFFYTWKTDCKREKERIQREKENNRRDVDFFAEIKSIKKDEERIHGEDEELNLYFVNKGCPITLLSLHFDEGNDNFKMHVDLLPARLEHGDVLKIPEQDLPFPVNREKIDSKVCFYVIDSFGDEYLMRRIKWKAHPTQPKISKAENM